jgi:demethylmenaquinone methyltransferase/2-methoxy-6-polyprenyl-1,4-benzoquinol methylase
MMATQTERGHDPRAERVDRFFHGNGSSYDRCVAWMTLGADLYWKRRIVAKIPPSRAILDLACGTGILTFRLAQRFPGVRMVGVDLTEDFLQVARQKAACLGVDAEFVHGNAETVPLPKEAFDCVVSSYIPKYVDAGRLLDNVGPALKPGGTLVLHDFHYPVWWDAWVVWRAYFQLCRVLWRPFFPGWMTAIKELPGLIRSSPWVKDFTEGLRARGYVDVQVETLTRATAAIVWAKKGA